MDIIYCYIKEQYFIDHSHFIKMLDPGNFNKQSRRSYLCVKISTNENAFYIPLRNNLGADIRPYGRIGHSIPSYNRKKAGLDYRYALIINNSSYIELPSSQRLPNSQLKKIFSDYKIIKSEFFKYLNGFIKALNKGRIEREPLYRESSLINFVPNLVDKSVINTREKVK